MPTAECEKNLLSYKKRARYPTGKNTEKESISWAPKRARKPIAASVMLKAIMQKTSDN